MKFKHAFLKSAALLAILTASQARADLLVLSPPSGNYLGTSFTQGGYTFSAPAGLANWYNEESRYSPDVGDLLTSGSVTISSNTGSPFDFTQIDLASIMGNWSNNVWQTGNIDFTFNFANGSQSTSVVTLSAALTPTTGLQTASFNENDLTSIVMTAVSTPSDYVQFNDVGLSAYTAPNNGGVTPTPEMPTYLMGLLGLGGIALLRRRQLQA